MVDFFSDMKLILKSDNETSATTITNYKTLNCLEKKNPLKNISINAYIFQEKN